jgi:hypothetical protein
VEKIPSHNNNTKDRRDQMLISGSNSNRLLENSKMDTTRITERVTGKNIGLSQRTTQVAEVTVPKISSGIFSEDSKKPREDKWKKKRE